MVNLRHKNNGFAHLFLVIMILLTVGVVGFAGWAVWRAHNDKTNASKTETSDASEQAAGLSGDTSPQSELKNGGTNHGSTTPSGNTGSNTDSGSPTTGPTAPVPVPTAPESSSKSSTSSSSSGIRGTVYMGAMTNCWNCQSVRGMQATLDIRKGDGGLKSSGGEIIKTIKTDSSGNFSTKLNPGSYVVVARAQGSMTASPQPVTVSSGHYATIAITYN